jgi:pyruvate/2-oxoglutarate/acetoin dehydrogenase E1 component
MSDYKLAIKEEMEKLAKIPNVVYMGQQVLSEDFYGTLKDVPKERRIEMPVAEEMQTGIALGMALEGILPVSIYQRMDFLPRACDQLVNHLDILKETSQGKFDPKVILISTVGSTKPMDVGLQHNKDLVEGFTKLFRNIKVLPVKTVEEVRSAYKVAVECSGSVLIIWYQDLF